MRAAAGPVQTCLPGRRYQWRVRRRRGAGARGKSLIRMEASSRPATIVVCAHLETGVATRRAQRTAGGTGVPVTWIVPAADLVTLSAPPADVAADEDAGEARQRDRPAPTASDVAKGPAHEPLEPPGRRPAGRITVDAEHVQRARPGPSERRQPEPGQRSARGRPCGLHLPEPPGRVAASPAGWSRPSGGATGVPQRVDDGDADPLVEEHAAGGRRDRAADDRRLEPRRRGAAGRQRATKATSSPDTMKARSSSQLVRRNGNAAARSARNTITISPDTIRPVTARAFDT